MLFAGSRGGGPSVKEHNDLVKQLAQVGTYLSYCLLQRVLDVGIFLYAIACVRVSVVACVCECICTGQALMPGEGRESSSLSVFPPPFPLPLAPPPLSPSLSVCDCECECVCGVVFFDECMRACIKAFCHVWTRSDVLYLHIAQ